MFIFPNSSVLFEGWYKWTVGDLSSEANQSKLQQITLLEKFSASQDKKNYIGEVYRGNEYDVPIE